MNPREFHWGETPETDAFFRRNPNFYNAFARLMELANKTFGREYSYKDRLQLIGFNLGETCRVDFLEILFLAVHGYGIGAAKLLRGLYERSVALAYMIKHPEKNKAERFFNYAAIQEYKVMISAVELVGEKVFDEAMSGKTAAAEIKQFREMVKSDFQVPVCRKCYKKGTCQHMTTAFSWDEKGVQAQAQDVGEPYTKLYLAAYAIPNMNVHATLASAMQEYHKGTEDERKTKRDKEGDNALRDAHALLLGVIGSQNDLFSLGLEQEIEACEKDWGEVWGPRHNAGDENETA